jgi:succinate-semialdehyde dehydrogenase/glutarate-semialdehyde dehydrogenase
LKVGEGTRDGVQIGPLINDDAMTKVEQHVDDAKAHGGKVSLGGSRVKLEGLADRFYSPTLIENMSRDMLLWREETFGPVAPLRRFRSDDEAVEMANDSEFGLAAYFFTRDVGRLMRVAERLEYGIVGANDGAPSTAQAPFGGVKHSGFGREGGKYVMDEYTEIKYVSLGL